MAWYDKLRNVFRRERTARGITDEIAFHLAERADALRREGMSDAEAQREARRRFGPRDLQRERTHDADVFVWLESWLGDVRFAFRALARRPGFVAAAVLTLALGVGANSAIFSVVRRVVFGELPYREADRLVAVASSDGEDPFGVSELEQARYRELPGVFAGVGAWSLGWTNLTGGGEAERLPTAFIDAGTLPTLGVAPALGRAFTAEEDLPGAGRVAILSHGLWLRRFGADSGVLGRTVQANGNLVQVIGVMSEEFRLPSDYAGTPSALLRPLAIGEADPRNFHYLSVVGRLADGVTVVAARGRMRVVSRTLREEISTLPERFEVQLVPLREDLFGSVSATLLVLQGAVALVLLIACLNVANLLLVRTEGRGHELAVRQALGASRGRLVRQLCTEAAVLGVGGGLAGLALALGLVRVVRLLNPPGVPRIDEVTVDFGVAAFAGLVALGAGLLAGLAPIFRLGGRDGQSTLRQEGRGATLGVLRHRLQRSLVIAEIAIGFMLAIGAGLLGRSYQRMSGVDLGFRADRVVSMQITLPSAQYRDKESARAFYRALAQEARALPGVQGFGGTNQLPLASTQGDWGIRIEGREEERLPGGRRPWADWSVVTEGYFEAIGFALVRGRFYTEADGEGSLPVVVINQTAAQRYWPGQDALGARFKMSADIDTVYRTVIGIVRDVRHSDVASTDRPQMYLPHSQFPATAGFPVGSLSLVARAGIDPAGVATSIERLARAKEPNAPVSNVRGMNRVVSAALSVGRFTALLFGAFGVLGLCLVAVGVYGVVAYAVAERTRELGIRAALGALPGGLALLVLRQSLAIAAGGIALGLAGAWIGSALLEGMLFGVAPRDPMVFAAIALLLLGVALAASFLPARQATRADPMTALRG